MSMHISRLLDFRLSTKQYMVQREQTGAYEVTMKHMEESKLCAHFVWKFPNDIVTSGNTICQGTRVVVVSAIR